MESETSLRLDEKHSKEESGIKLINSNWFLAFGILKFIENILNFLQITSKLLKFTLTSKIVFKFF